MMDNIFLLSEKVGNVDPKLYRSISLDSYDFTTLSDDYMGKIYFQVSFKGVPLNKMLYLFQLTYCCESEMLVVNLQKLKYLPDFITKHGVIVKYE